MNQLILVGPMGVGKTTIGKKVSKKLEVEFRDTDKLISAEHGAIADIFANHGEGHFRALETQVLKSLSAFEGVIATGGGIVLAEENREFLVNKKVVYLSTKGKQMRTRFIGSKKRPLLKNGYQDWIKIYEQRKSLYEQVATVEISIDGKPLSAVADRCVEVFRSENA
jgi:shikimate kinase